MRWWTRKGCYWKPSCSRRACRSGPAASVPEWAGGETLLARAKARASCGRLSKVWADGGFDGTPFRDRTRETCGWELEVVPKPPGRKGFAVLPRRWVVERTFAWLGRSRRLSKDYEQRPDSGEAYVRLAMTQLMLRRLRPEPTD